MANTDTNSSSTAGGLTGGAEDKGAAEKGAAEKGAVQASGQGSEKGGLTGGAEVKVDPAADKAAGEKAAADKLAADKAKAADVDVKFGDLQLDEKLVGKFKATAKELGLDSAKAQKVADIYVEARKHEDAQISAALEKQEASWLEAMKADKELGVDLSKSVLSARKALQKFGTPELTKLINGYGLANNPELTRVFARIGKAIAEDSIAGAGDAGAVEKNSAEAAQRRAYPKMFQRLDRERNGA